MSPLEMNNNTSIVHHLSKMDSTSESDHHVCSTSLGLSLGLASFKDGINNKKEMIKSVVSLKFDHVVPALSLGPSDQGSSSYSNENNNNNHNTKSDQEKISNRRVISSDQDDEEEASPRKKLRLTKDQSAILEDIFKEHSTLNPNQKQALAKQLSLRPRQVEVWFQNRRARTKLKQTETECEVMKKCCERLTEENKRLNKELNELKSIKLYMHMQSICPSCDPSFINAAAHHRYASSSNPDLKPVFVSSVNRTKRGLFFPHSSAAC